jgi:myo-inositol 2-dehydrogenase / D-chiro-inositol 1-dehydrogenase
MSSEVKKPNPSTRLSRRDFIGAATGAMIVGSHLVRGTAANSDLRVGLLGCGGRGTADATDLVETGKARVVALGDLFQDQLDTARKHFDELGKSKGHAAIDPSQMFRGPNAYQQIVASKEVDIVVITTPPYFHPGHLEAVVAAGKHVYCEKPVAVDVPGAKRVMRAGEQAQGRLSLDVGFQIRNAPPFVELVKRVQGGAIGKIACGEAYYYGTALDRPAWPNASPVERRIRNWVWDRVLSGDIIVEQNIHAIDVCNWTLQAHPVRAWGAGGRKVLTHAGDCYDHFNVVYEYPQSIQVTLNSTQFNKGWWGVNERFFGSKGVSESPYSGTLAIYGDDAWVWGGNKQKQEQSGSQQFSASGVFHDNLEQADPEKKKAFVESILNNSFHNQAATGAESALSAMLGRQAAYTCKPMTWEELLSSEEVWDPGINLNQFA